MTPLRTRLVSATTALALALGSLSFSAAPAAALSDDGEKALGWILGLGAAAILLNEMENGSSQHRGHRNPGFGPDIRDGRVIDGRFDGRRNGPHRPDSRLTVPAQCLIAVRTPNGRREVVSGRCADEVRLPHACAFDLITDHGRRETVYGRNCLEGQGYRIGRR